MRLIDPGPGELLDRETILVLKIEAARRRPGAIHHHFASELTAVSTLLADARKAHGDKWAGWYASLLAVNRRVWVAIDRLRESDPDDVESAAHWGREALWGNDERARLIHEINRECGVVRAEEKIG